MPRLPAQVQALLDALSAGLPPALGRNLVGIYLYGSLTQRAFNPARSDIDLIVVSRRPLSAAQFRRTAELLERLGAKNSWGQKLQLTFLLRDSVLETGQSACSYQFGALKRTGTDGNPIIWLNVLKSGVVLYGQDPADFVPPISRARLNAALRLELEYLRDELSDRESEWAGKYFYRAYAVLTLCRILYSWHTGRVSSKPVAARWAMKQLPAQWHPLIEQALNGSAPESSRKLPAGKLAQLIEVVERQLAASVNAPSIPPAVLT